jgi:hypothetical protein
MCKKQEVSKTQTETSFVLTETPHTPVEKYGYNVDGGLPEVGLGVVSLALTFPG